MCERCTETYLANAEVIGVLEAHHDEFVALVNKIKADLPKEHTQIELRDLTGEILAVEELPEAMRLKYEAYVSKMTTNSVAGLMAGFVATFKSKSTDETVAAYHMMSSNMKDGGEFGIVTRKHREQSVQ